MIELLIVLVLIGLNGLFALSELAVVSARRSRLKAMAQSGKRGAEQALALAAEPGRFLSAVQIGITLIGIINGAYSGEAFGYQAAAALREVGVPAGIAAPLGYGIVIVLVTYLSVIVGELVPKRLALRNAEGIACKVAPGMQFFARIASPAVWLLDTSTELVFRMFGQSAESESRVTDEEIRALIAEAESSGVIEKGEHQMITSVMRFADRRVVGLMTPRTEVEWVDRYAPPDEIKQRILATQHSRMPVGDGSIDALVGVVQTREVLAAALTDGDFTLDQYIRKAPVISETMEAFAALAVLRNADVPMALIHDEYGAFEGLITPADVLEAIAGVFRSDLDASEPYAVQRDDGSWLLSGGMPVESMADTLGFALPREHPYATLAGYLLNRLQRLPKVGESVEADGWRFEIVDLDGRRIDKVIASRATVSRRVVS